MNFIQKIETHYQVEAAPAEMKQKIAAVAKKAEDAFWETVAKEFPEIKTGDFHFSVAGEMTKKMEEWITHWVDANQETAAPSASGGELNLKCKDFTLVFSPLRFSARQSTQYGDVAIPGHDWGVRIKKAAYLWISKNQPEIRDMTFHEFVTALKNAVGKYPHTYNQWD